MGFTYTQGCVELTPFRKVFHPKLGAEYSLHRNDRVSAFRNAENKLPMETITPYTCFSTFLGSRLKPYSSLVSFFII